MDEDDVAIATTETRVAGDLVTRELAILPGSWNAEARTIDVTFTTGARGARFNWSRWEMIDEELDTEASSVRLDRINRGGPVLNTHKSYDLENQIGVVVPGSARMENGVGIATLKLSERDSIAGIVADIAAGIIRNISVGYLVHVYEITEREGQRPLYRAMDWEVYEISFVPMPFDPDAQVRSHQTAQGGYPCVIRRSVPAIPQETNMDEDEVTGGAPGNETRGTETVTPPAPTQRQQPAAVTVAAIRTAARNAGLDDTVAFELIERHEATPLTSDALMADIGRRFAERDAPAPTQNRISITRDAGDTMRRGMGDAILHRMSPGSAGLSDVGREFRSMNLLRMAEEFLASEGVVVRGMSGVEIAERALHASSDFPALMANGMNRRLRMAYEENRPSYRTWARRAPNAPNFKSIDVVQLSALPDLLRVNEGGEVKFGTISDGSVSYTVVTFARALGITRQTIVNDDLRALERVATGFASAASRLENRTVYSRLTANANMPDGQPLFSAAHGNLAAAGAAISAVTLGAGRTRMRLQKGLQAEELNLAPRFLIVPATQEQLAYQFTSSQFVPAKASDTNEFRSGGRTALEPVVEAILDANSTTRFYLAADSMDVDTVEYCYLEGTEGVQMSSRLGFTVDGVEVKATLDFGAAVIDHRGLDANPGA
jgi:hypothetical protein